MCCIHETYLTYYTTYHNTPFQSNQVILICQSKFNVFTSTFVFAAFAQLSYFLHAVVHRQIVCVLLHARNILIFGSSEIYCCTLPTRFFIIFLNFPEETPEGLTVFYLYIYIYIYPINKNRYSSINMTNNTLMSSLWVLLSVDLQWGVWRLTAHHSAPCFPFSPGYLLQQKVSMTQLALSKWGRCLRVLGERLLRLRPSLHAPGCAASQTQCTNGSVRRRLLL